MKTDGPTVDDLSFDDLLIDGVSADIASHPDIQSVLSEITNVLVRDIWIESPSSLGPKTSDHGV